MAIIVVVEDQPDSLRLLATLLSLRGHAVIPLPNGDRLVETMRAHSPEPDLLLLDIQLPGRDGFALLQDLRALEGRRHWKVVALTAHAAPADRDRAMAAGFDGYITKPIDVRTFPREVASYLGAAAEGSAGSAESAPPAAPG
jgi:CheY-like chemotaxis protein